MFCHDASLGNAMTQPVDFHNHLEIILQRIKKLETFDINDVIELATGYSMAIAEIEAWRGGVEMPDAVEWGVMQ